VTIVEFSDFECRFCRDVQPALKQVLESYGKDVQLVFKHLPLEGHRNAVPAARAAYCASEQDRFWQFHDVLFATESLSPGVFDRIASEIGLGLPRFKECLSSEHSRAAVIRDIETARSFRIDSTPSFLVNGKLFKGALEFAQWQKIIERELNQTSSRN
jgi:protein-disulfide isomerase